MRKHLSLILLAAGVSLASGCAGMTKNWSKGMPWGEKASKIEESKYQTPVKIVALWSPAMYNAAGKPPIRGFGGRLYFYNGKNEPISVEGQLVVYGFNDTNKSSDHKQPDRRIAYTPEQFSGHFSPTELGASYSVWVPWDAVGNPQAEISLLPIFTSSSGPVVMGQQSIGFLPGPETPVPEGSIEEKVFTPKVTTTGDVTKVGYEEPLPASGAASSRMQTLSVTLPQSLAERIAASDQNSAPLKPLTPDELASLRLKARPLEHFVPTPANPIPGVHKADAKESAPQNPTSLFPPLQPLTRSERSLLPAPASQPPQPVLDPALTSQLPAEPRQGLPSSP